MQKLLQLRILPLKVGTLSLGNLTPLESPAECGNVTEVGVDTPDFSLIHREKVNNLELLFEASVLHNKFVSVV